MTSVNQNNNTTSTAKMQELADKWQEEIESFLPTNLDETAKETGAIVRKRGFKNILGFLKVMLIYASTTLSLRMITLCANTLKVSDVSDTAWRKRIINSVEWLTVILSHILS